MAGNMSCTCKRCTLTSTTADMQVHSIVAVGTVGNFYNVAYFALTKIKKKAPSTMYATAKEKIVVYPILLPYRVFNISNNCPAMGVAST